MGCANCNDTGLVYCEGKYSGCKDGCKGHGCAVCGKRHPQEVKAVLEFDTIHTIEKIAGKRIEGDKELEGIALGVFFQHNAQKKQMLVEQDDFYHGIPLPDVFRLTDAIGFETVLEIPFLDKEEKKTNKLFFRWQEKNGILLVFDTYCERSINGGNFYYNWRPADVDGKWYTLTSSGRWEGDNETGCWAGGHDCREALCHHIRQMELHGQFMKPWKANPYMGFTHYMDWVNEEKRTGERYPRDYSAIHKIEAERYGLLPERVRTAIGPFPKEAS